MIEINVEIDGMEESIGRAVRVVDEAMAYGLMQVGQAGSERVHRILDQRIKHPTPYYETQITITDHPPGQVRVHDRGVDYGPWLEGISTRNMQSRFKGYHAFALAGGFLAREAQDIAERSVARYLARAGL
jgi:hypothetical protein